MSTESPKTYFFWSGNALPDPPCYDQYTDDDDDDKAERRMMQCQPQASQKFKTGQDFLEIFRPKIPQLAESYMEPLSLPAQNEGKRKGKNKKR